MEDEAELLESLWAKIDGSRGYLNAGWRDREWQPRICRVPRELSDLQDSAYRPRALCIGPLNRAEAGLQFEAMGAIKLEYMLRLFGRLQNQAFQECVAAMLQIEEKARRCYAQQSQPLIGVAHFEAPQPRPKSSSQRVRECQNPKSLSKLHLRSDVIELNPLASNGGQLNPEIQVSSGVEKLKPGIQPRSDVEELNRGIGVEDIPVAAHVADGIQFGRISCEYDEPSTAAAVQPNESVSEVGETDQHRRAEPVEVDEKTLKDTPHYIGFQRSPPRCRAEKVKFAETMLIDGCFIIELVYSRYKLQSFDPILSNNFKFSAVKHDLMLLGNQIPFFVLQELFDRTLGKIQGEVLPSLPSLILSFFKGTIEAITGADTAVPEEEEDQQVHHILHLLHQRHLPTPSSSSPSAKTEKSRNCDCILQICCGKGEQDQPIIEGGLKYSATELHFAGVKFVAGSNKDLFCLQFNTLSRLRLCRRGRLEIPPFSVKDSTETLLRNLIAMEQCFPDLENYFTSHAFLMDKLINTPEDVKLLENAGIIRNYLGSPEEVANIFNTICKNVNIHPFKFQELCVQLNHYCNSWWPRRLAKLKRDYFASPWSAISFVAAIMLFLLTLLQTIYTMLSFY